MIRLLALAVAAAGLAPAAAAAEPVGTEEAVAQMNGLCVQSREAFLRGGAVEVRLKPRGRVVQEQKYAPGQGRIRDTLWPTVVRKGVGTYDRGGYVLDARLRRSQIKQAARYLGFTRRPWVLARGQYGIAPARRSYRQHLRTDLLAPDRFVDIDSTSVPSQASRCASHLLERDAEAAVTREVGADRTVWSMEYQIEEDYLPLQVEAQIVESGGLIRSGSLKVRGPGVDIENYARWTYAKTRVSLPARSTVVSQRQWIKATDAAALVMDIRYLARNLEGRTKAAQVRRAARQEARLANRGHVVPIRVRNVPRGVEVYGRNPYTREVVVFEVVIRPVPQAVSRRVR
jgi:hypothetical protein